MVIFLATLILMGFLSMALLQIFRNRRAQEIADFRIKRLPYYLLLDSGFVLTDVIAGGALEQRLPMDIYMSFIPLAFLTSSMNEEEQAVTLSRCAAGVQVLVAAYNILCGLGLFRLPAWIVGPKVQGFAIVNLFLVYMLTVCIRVREVRLVMKMGNVWSCLGIVIDGIYLSAMSAFVALLIIYGDLMWMRIVLMVLMWLEVMALVFRVSGDSIFVFWSRQERRIVESMKVSVMEMASEKIKGNEVYKDIYDRIVALFEEKKMYLNSGLTINDVVKVVFTNKLYISRAISRFTGRNFCQFVNYYRVRYSVNTFRDNPELKVNELALMSGFNSVVSFSMAFRLYMCESPSDWCRKEKNKLLRKKK